eukprot:Anaeramoba_ignava/a610037_62.p1 GENE.a610037_62~~a610037_62.p1  ORF type:complete len:255 (-),score=59.85 a610037_62:20-784(-)
MNATQKFFGLISQECYEILLEQKIMDTNCLKQIISKLLGLGIVVFSVILKVPQIIKILKEKSAKGLSVMMFILDSVIVAIPLVYGYLSKFPLTTYGENAFLLIQNLLIVFLIFLFSKKTILFFIPFGVISGFIAASAFGQIDIFILQKLQLLSTPLIILSRAPQIYLNFKNKSTGKLSLISTLLAFLGTIVRLFTVIQDVKDQLLIISTVTSVVLNGILVLQFFIFSNKSEKTSDPNSQKQNSTNTPKRPRRAD